MRFNTALSLSLLLVIATPQAAGDDLSPVRIDVVGPMTGNSVSIGMQYKAGLMAALEDIVGDTIMGRPLEIFAHDDDCRAAIARELAEVIVTSERPDLVIGHSCSAATIAAAPIYADKAVLQITPASTNPKVTEMGIGTIFRMIGRDDLQAEITADYIAKEFRSKRIGILHAGNAYSLGLAAAVATALKTHGISPILTRQIEAGANSYINEIRDFIGAEIDVAYIVSGVLDGGIFVRQLRLLGSPMRVLGSDTLVSEVFLQAAGEASEGVYFTFPPDLLRLESAQAAARSIARRGVEPAGYALLAYAATEVWVEGVRRASALSAESVASAIREAPVETILGPVSFDARGDIVTEYPSFVWYQWQSGERMLAP